MITIKDCDVKFIVPGDVVFPYCNFEYGGAGWIRDGCEFYKIFHTDLKRIPVKPHEYFEAYTAIKNEEAKRYMEERK